MPSLPCVYVCACVCLFVCVSACLCVCLSVCLSACVLDSLYRVSARYSIAKRYSIANTASCIIPWIRLCLCLRLCLRLGDVHAFPRCQPSTFEPPVLQPYPGVKSLSLEILESLSEDSVWRQESESGDSRDFGDSLGIPGVLSFCCMRLYRTCPSIELSTHCACVPRLLQPHDSSCDA